MTILRASISIIFILLAAYIALMNLGCIIVNERNKRKGIEQYHSTMPFVSIALAVLSYPVFPFNPKWWLFLIPIFDIGTWQLLLYLPRTMADGAFKK